MSLRSFGGLRNTTVLHWPAVAENKGTLVLIPGNPGLVEYYTTYLEHIQKQRPELEIYAVSHAGFSTTESPGTKQPYYSLESQIQHKCDFLVQIAGQSQHKRMPVYLLAHSMGCYVVQKVAQKLQDHPRIEFRFVGLNFPCVMDIAKSDSGQKLTWLNGLLPVASVVSLFANCLNFLLPEWAIRRIVQTQVKRGDSEAEYAAAVEGTLKLVRSPHLVRQALGMAVEEMEHIRNDQPLQDWFFSSFLEKVPIWGYFAATDHWVADATRASILEYRGKNVAFAVADPSSAITHSFCIDQSVNFADVTVSAMAGK